MEGFNKDKAAYILNQSIQVKWDNIEIVVMLCGVSNLNTTQVYSRYWFEIQTLRALCLYVCCCRKEESFDYYIGVLIENTLLKKTS